MPWLSITLQLVATVGVLAGVGVVVYELQQTRTLVQAEISQARMIEFNNDQAALYGENGAEALAKACLTPDELTDAEKLVVDTVFWNFMRRAYSAKRLFDISGLNPNWKLILRLQLEMVLSYPMGEKWLDQYTSIDFEIREAVLELRPSLSESNRSCRDIYNAFE